MAKKNPGDILTSDWNPVIGCRRYSAACANCWFLDGIFPWQQRLGNIPLDVSADMPYLFEKRMTLKNLKPKNGIIGVCQHGDLFWDLVSEKTILGVLDLIDQSASCRNDRTKYVLWTKRSARMATILSNRNPEGLPGYLACAVSIENEDVKKTRMGESLQ